ncbi:hypothetical protein LCGC14_1943390 [marine sediment metagenome]|uniref:Uncharacterized protein n=1 Tax=marine sediment metagenome TaxID=412755 RepID=A0A0F9HXY7_9ZZZZ
MSAQVRITATGDLGLSIELMLGDENRAWRDLEPGESVDLGVGGNQTLVIDLPREPATPFITPTDEPAEEAPWVTGKEEDLPVGVDVLASEAGRSPDLVGAEAPVAAAGEEAEPLEDAKDSEAQSIGAGEVGDIGALFGEGEAEAESSVIKTLEADSPLEVGSLSDLPSPFDTDDGESADGDAEEAEDTGDEKAQA